MTYLRTAPLSQAENSVLPLEVYLKIQTLLVKNIIFTLGLTNQMTLKSFVINDVINVIMLNVINKCYK